MVKTAVSEGFFGTYGLLFSDTHHELNLIKRIQNRLIAIAQLFVFASIQSRSAIRPQARTKAQTGVRFKQTEKATAL